MTDKNSYLNRPLYRYKSLYKDTSLYIYKGKWRISDQAIKDFQDLHERKFGKKITPEVAERDFTLLLRTVELINKIKVQ
jgi:hypothetical protein